MRRAPFLVMLLLLFCAGPLLAQSPGVIPMPQQSKAKLAKKHLKHKAVATKPAATKSAKTKSAAGKPAEPKPVRRRRAAGKSPATGKPGMVKNAIDARKAKEAKAEPAKTKTEPEAKSEAPSDVVAGTPQGERQKIQDALAWSGDYTGTAGGDDSTLTAIKNFQKRHKAKITGILAPSERADLLAAAKQHEDEFGWSVVVDPATGIRIGLPTKLVTQAHDAGRGTRWSSKHGEVQVETFRIKDANLKLADLFEKMKKEPAMRKVETSVLHDDNFFIGGLQGLKLFAVRARMRNGEVRGFTVMYDQMMETIVAPVLGAMANTFSPFPERSAPFAALAKSVEYGNGILVSAQGHIVTDVQITQGCQVIVAAGLGNADRVAEDRDNGLALLRVYGARKISPLSLAREAPKTGELTLVGIPDPKEQDGGRKLTEVKARLAANSAIELRQPVPMAGFSGAAVLDAKGQVLGIMEMGHAVLASVEAAAPPVRLVSAATISGFLDAQHVPAAPTPAADAKTAVVRIICVRK